MNESENDPQNIEKMLRSLLGEQAANEALNAMRSAGIDPASLAQHDDMPTGPGANIAMLGMFNQIRQTLMGADGPVNWELARDIARQGAHANGADPALTAAQAAQARQALTVADLWLDSVTELPPAGTTRQAWSRAQWVEQTMPIWQRLCEPVAANAARALSQALRSQLPEDGAAPIEFGGALSGMQLTDVMERMSATVFGMQVGNAIGTLAQEVFGPTGTGLPLLDEPMPALVVTNIENFGTDLDIPAQQVQQFIALREAAHTRLFNAVPWLRSHLLTAVETYSREITIDTEAIQDAARSMDPLSASQMPQTIAVDIFASAQTPAQQAALTKLETTLAVIEGWVETVTIQAGAPHLPELMKLVEMMRRHRASGGPAERVFAQLLGYQARPRRSREAATAWNTVQAELGQNGRDQLWSHPHLMFNAAELDTPTTILEQRKNAAAASQNIDIALEKLLEGTLGWAEGMQEKEQEKGKEGEGPDIKL